MANHPHRSKSRKQIERMESQLLVLRSCLSHIERVTAGYDSMCTMGLLHERVKKALNDDFQLGQ